ncbi:MAG: HAD-IA family hydrolase [Thermodesulfobacteriota bacterium]
MINKKMIIFGRVVEGTHKAEYFTGLSWVQSQCLKKLGFEPFAGTLNLEIGQDNLGILSALEKEQLDELIPPDDGYCSAKICPVYLGNIKGALILPDENVDIHGKSIIEILAPVHLRKTLNLKDGDKVELQFKKNTIGSKIDVHAVLFDLDGTLIDSIESYYRIVEIAFEKLDFPPVSRQKIFQAARQDPFDWSQILPDIPGETYEQTSREVWKLIEKIYPKEFLKNVHPFPFTGSTLKIIHAAKIKIAIATSTPKKNINDKIKILDQAGVLDLIEVVICAGDVKRQKPYPDPLLLCKDRLGLTTDQCLYVGDMGIDIDAGRAAGMKTAGVLTGFETLKDLKAKKPDIILTSIADLPDVLDI